MNKKNLILLGAIVSFILGILSFDPYVYGICVETKKCLFDGWSFSISEPLILTSISYFITSIFTFLISDSIFKRWIKFAIAWMIMAVIAIAVSPVYSPYIFGGPTKESVSIWMGTLFVIISLTMFAVMTWRERRHKN